MKLSIDSEAGTLRAEEGGATRELPLYSREAFELVSRQWVRIGFALRYSYAFTWMGRPIVQLPEDVVRVQEAVHRVRPDVIVETGVAHGGSLVLYASLCKALGKGRVVGVDVAIRPANREALVRHELAPLITLVEGSSTDPSVVARVRALVAPGETALVLLDSCHDAAHVAAELEAYAPLVTPGSYLVATDGIMRDLWDVPLGQPRWRDDNPAAAAAEFAARHPEFVLGPPPRAFDESGVPADVTYWPGGWLRRLPDAPVDR